MARRSAAIIVVVVLLLAVGAGANWLHSYEEQLKEFAREPLCDRWLQSIEQDLGSQQYQEAARLIEGLMLSYPQARQAHEARGLYPRTLLGQVRQYLEQGQYQYALGRLDQLLNRYPDSPEAAQGRGLYPSLLLEQALQDWNKGDRRQAIAGLDALLVKYPDSPESARARELYPALLLEEVQLDKDVGKYSDALSHLGELEREYPDSGEAALAEGLRYEIYGAMRDESIARNLAVVNAMFPSRVGQRLAATSCVIRNVSENPYGQDAAGIWDGYRIILYAPVAFSFNPSGVILHEWGHVIDDYFLSDGEKAEYRRIRGIPANVPWMNYSEYDYDDDAYHRSPNEDFAAVFKTLISGDKWYDYTVYGPIGDPAQMELWMVEATSN
jgi:tetratricopeptide (TPR) repeat protein